MTSLGVLQSQPLSDAAATVRKTDVFWLTEDRTGTTTITARRKKRRESGEDKREFEELLWQDWLEFDLCCQAIQVSYDSVRGARGQIARVISADGLSILAGNRRARHKVG
jgi:hypothetical protein